MERGIVEAREKLRRKCINHFPRDGSNFSRENERNWIDRVADVGRARGTELQMEFPFGSRHRFARRPTRRLEFISSAPPITIPDNAASRICLPAERSRGGLIHLSCFLRGTRIVTRKRARTRNRVSMALPRVI